MTDLELLHEARACGVELWLEGDTVRFRAPRGSLSTELREALKARKDALRDLLRDAPRAASSGGARPITPVPRDGELPLSFAQQRLWFLDQLHPGDASYNIPTALRLRGALDVERMRRAFDEVVRRHQALRTAFVASDGQPTQIVHPATTWALPVVDLASTPAAEREAEVQRLGAEDARLSFDLASGQPLRTTLLRLAEEEHVLLLSMHHIVSDGWSIGVLVEELLTLYVAFSVGDTSPLPELPIQYVDFAAWQRQWLSGERLDAQLRYWTTRLAGAPLLELPTDRARPATSSLQGGFHEVNLAEDLAQRLLGLAREKKATPFMALLAGLLALLHRYTGQTDLCIGVPVANRNRAEIEPLIGFFVNTLVLRVDASGNPRFADLLGRTRDAALEAFAHQDLPFERLIDALGGERGGERASLVRVMFALQNAPMRVVNLPGLVIERLPAETGTAKFDLTITLAEDGHGITGGIEYSADVFDAETIARFSAHLDVLLRAAVADPDARIGDLLLIGDEERQKLEAWNETSRSFPRESTIHEVFRAQARRTPEAIAVRYGDRTLSYAELDRRSDGLARHLVTLGAGPDVRVGLCLERSEGLVVAVLGILKAGSAYVPLDVEYPRDRIALMLEDAGVQVLITETSMQARLPLYAGKLVRLDAGGAELAQAALDTPLPSVASGHLAYVIYTSGSTGRPKGIGVEHRAVLRLVMNTDFIDLGPPDRVAQVSNTSFDAATFELWGALLSGATLVGIPRDVVLSPRAFAVALREEGISAMFLTAALFNQVARELPGAFETVKTLLVGGEALDPRSIAEVLRSGSPARLLNGYGPTETTTFAAWHLITSVPEGAGSIPIGRPLANTALHVLDASMELVPIGMRGELYIGGPGVARGYLGRPALTAERFVPDPFSREPGARLYRTGDRVLRRPDGLIEFLGRIDQQVKLRGFRIELGEIEAELGSHPAVRHAAVVLREDTPGDRRLVAYVVPAEMEGAIAPALSAHLAERLPPFMIPSAFVELERLPLTPNGKLDRKALPPPERRAVEELHTQPSTPTEETLARVFCDLLGLAQVGAGGDFFALGGHSLLATRVMSRIQAAFRVDLPLRVLFEAPTVAGLAARVDAASAALGGERRPPITKAPRDGELPLSFAQQRLWFLDQLDPGSSAYIISIALRLVGALDVEALRRVFEEIVRRHESLRTTFTSREGRAAQIINPPPTWSLPLREISEASPDRELSVRRLAETHARAPFDLTADPLLRTTLVRLEPEVHVLLLAIHHIVSDGWSMGVLVEEISALYAAFAADKPSPLPELAIQYADFAAWQHRFVAGDVRDTQLRYWQERLAGAEPLDLPTDRPRPLEKAHRGLHHAFIVPAEVGRALEGIGRRHGATPFLTTLALFAIVLHRYSQREDLCLSTPVANRHHGEVEPLIGFFVNTVVLRVNLAENPTFSVLLGRLRELSLEAYDHQDLPFERIVEALGSAGSADRAALTRVMFALQSAPRERISLPGLTIEPLDITSDTAKFDLTLSFSASEGALHGNIEADADLFDRATIERMAEHFMVVGRGVVEHPDARIGDLPLLSGPELLQLDAWNATSAPFPRDGSIHGAFEAQVKRAPDAVAVIDDGTQTTYAELHRRAQRLAHHLRALGVGPEDRVGVCLERSVDTVVGFLAILQAGGAYVPLDPDHPAERLAFMLDDARVRVLLSTRAMLDRLPARDMRVVLMDDDQQARGSAPASPLPRAFGASLAYVIYTSGSTGQPKGVAIDHRAVLRLVLNTDYVDIQPSDRIAQASNTSFDAATFEIWGALLCGATLVFVSREVTLSPERLAEQLRALQITTLFLTTALFHQVARRLPSAFAPLRTLLFGGEAIDPRCVDSVLRHGPPERLLHVYGPTETTTFASWHPVSSVPEGATTVPIGRPLANTTLHVVDRRLSPVPVGIPGELVIGGLGVGRGYLHRPALTAERFIPDPFSAEPGARLYRTGDLVKRRLDGTIEFLGRLDQQVKIRGFRIEPGEIEAALSTHASVRHAVVIVQEQEQSFERRLVAYVVPEAEPTTQVAAALREHLEQRLPHYMVPAAFVLLDALPLTANGKLDRRALPDPGPAHFPRQSAPELPPSDAELRVARIFSEVLGIDDIGARDDFFALGGHSLLATQVVSRVREAFGVELPLRKLFEEPTVAGIAAHVEAASTQPREGEGTIARARRDEPLALSFAQQRLWFLDQLEPSSSVYNIPLGLRLVGALDVEALRRVFEEVVRRHEALRTTFASRAGEPAQIVHPPAPWPLPIVDVSALDSSAREAHMAHELGRPFDLAAGPLMRTTLLRLADEEHILLLVMHHVVSDGWSMGVLVREVAALHAAFIEGNPSPLPELRLQYADFAVWQRRWLSGDVLATQLRYWKERLSNAPTLDLPTDHARPATSTHHAGRHRVTLSAELSAAVRALGHAHGCTPFMTLLSLFLILLQRWTGDEDLAVGTPVANRNRAEIEPLIGFFVNTLVLRVDLSDDPTLEALLLRVREAALGAYAHQDLPFERLVEELGAPRDLRRTPLFQVMFVLQNAPMSALTLPGLELEPVELPAEASKFDLELSLAEESGVFTGALLYNADLFEEATIARMAGHLEVLVEAAVRHAGQRIGRLPILTASERVRLLPASIVSSMSPSAPPDVVELFEKYAARAPRATALVAGEVRLDYAELDRRSNQLAHHLRSLGVGPDVVVAIAMAASIDAVIALLGVLKAGGAYAPLDTSHPKERLGRMLHGLRAVVVLTVAALAEALPLTGATTLCIDTDWPRIAREESTPVERYASGANLAYVIFTSGSTGIPKGVAVERRQLSAYVASIRGRLALPEGASYALVSTFAADLGYTVLYASLCGGGCLHVISQEQAMDAHGLGRYFHRHAIDCLKIVPSHFAALLATDAPERAVPRLRLIMGGEASSWEIVNTVSALSPGCVILNHYGPTETTVGVLTCDLDSDAVGRPPAPPLGRPLEHARVYVLDKHLDLSPIGVPGEIYIGGSSVARGYLDQPRETAERFIPDPFAGATGARMYRTGDRARVLPDGRILFLGRVDHQVKVRGFRIELAEIELSLAEHPALRHCAVLALENPSGEKDIVAYVVPRSEGEISIPALREHLEQKLPAHMVPAAFVVLAALPLTPNGKLDRRALLPYETRRDAREPSIVPPRDQIELELLTIWEDLLGARPISVRDDFFTLGGHSLLAVRLLARIETHFGRAVPLAALFRGATIEALASALRDGPSGRGQSPLVCLDERGERAPFFCVHAVGGSAFAFRALAGALGGERPVHAFQARGLDTDEPPYQDIHEMARDYVAALRAIQPEGPYHLGGWSFGGLVAFEMAWTLEQAGHDVAALILLDSFAPSVAPPRSLDAVAIHQESAPPCADEAYLRRVARVHHAHLEAAQRYRPQLYAGVVTLLRASDVQAEVIAAIITRDPTCGWGAHTTREVAVELVPGDHFSMLEPPRVTTLADAVRRVLGGSPRR